MNGGREGRGGATVQKPKQPTNKPTNQLRKQTDKERGPVRPSVLSCRSFTCARSSARAAGACGPFSLTGPSPSSSGSSAASASASRSSATQQCAYRYLFVRGWVGGWAGGLMIGLHVRRTDRPTDRERGGLADGGSDCLRTCTCTCTHRVSGSVRPWRREAAALSSPCAKWQRATNRRCASVFVVFLGGEMGWG